MVEKKIRPKRTMEIPESVFRANISTVPPGRIKFCGTIPDTPCLANFQRRSATWPNNSRRQFATQPHMPSTHLSLHYHIIFSTKDRHPFIADEWRARLHEYLGGLIRAADGIPEAIGGTNDHVHLMVGLPATIALAPFMQDIKQTSSRWIHETIGVKNLAWQPGYGAFTVSASNRDAVKEYIANQAEHHRTKTFQEEYVMFLQKHCVDYDEKYLW